MKRHPPEEVDEPTMFDAARARSTDPETSHFAAASVTNQTTIRAKIVRILISAELTDEEILDGFIKRGWSGTPSGVRTRRCELVESGVVEDSGRRRLTDARRESIVWRLRSPPGLATEGPC
jgi:hypothetical protein